MTFVICYHKSLLFSMTAENAHLLEDTETKSDWFLQKYFRLDADAIYHVAHQAQDMVISCKMRGRDGDKKCEELKKGHGAVFTTRYGVCYMFNAAAKNGGTIVSNYGGPNFGLELLIDMESEDSISNQLYQTSTMNCIPHKFEKLVYHVNWS